MYTVRSTKPVLADGGMAAGTIFCHVSSHPEPPYTYPHEVCVPMATRWSLCLSEAGGVGGIPGVLALACSPGRQRPSRVAPGEKSRWDLTPISSDNGSGESSERTGGPWAAVGGRWQRGGDRELISLGVLCLADQSQTYKMRK
ncbi:hypothetical protein BaRGS_00008519 [Batillaria attramentaria]|uniref:Uncharacterized protein n=1 Tax=Batillaria attramentaria TaxID=370345 RepID=A0ABD0LM27_9CAEN